MRRKMTLDLNNEDIKDAVKEKKADGSFDSISEKSYHTIKQGVKQIGKADINELISELRRKYLKILKSLYWEFLEEGQCTPESFLVLNESADSCLDDERQERRDWDYCKSYLYSDKSMQRIGWISQIPCIGRFFKNLFFN